MLAVIRDGLGSGISSTVRLPCHCHVPNALRVSAPESVGNGIVVTAVVAGGGIVAGIVANAVVVVACACINQGWGGSVNS